MIPNYQRGPLTSERTLGDIAEIFSTKPIENLDQVVYRTYGCPSEDTDEPQLLYATTVIEPGDCNGEYFMTRGHYHTKPERGEFMLTLSGQGVLLLMSRSGECEQVPLTPGSVCNIDGRFAHRAVNTGDQPLEFLVVWLSDCGHDYASIRESGFPVRLNRPT